MSLTLYRMVFINVQNPVTTNVGMLCIFKSHLYTPTNQHKHMVIFVLNFHMNWKILYSNIWNNHWWKKKRTDLSGKTNVNCNTIAIQYRNRQDSCPSITQVYFGLARRTRIFSSPMAGASNISETTRDTMYVTHRWPRNRYIWNQHTYM